MTKVAPTPLRTRPALAPGRAVHPDMPRHLGTPGHRRSATPSSLRHVLAPRSVAVVGAGRQRGGAGHEVLRALRDYGFGGRLFAVNVPGRPVCGVPGYPSVDRLPAPVDLLVLAVAPETVPDVLGGAGRLGARGAVLLGDRLAEHHRVPAVVAARRHGIRLLGPSHLGVLNTDPAVRLNATLSPERPPSGGLALAARSGALGIALLEEAVRDHCGVSSVVSVGQAIDVTVGELFGYWLDDPATRAVALSGESFGDPEIFAAAARMLGRRKPVLLSAPAPWAADGEDPLRGTGIIRTAGIRETVDTARMVLDQPLPAGNRMAVIGNADGLTAFTAQVARAHGFDIVALSGATRAQLPAGAGSVRCDNPIELGVDAPAARLADAVEIVADSGEADILLLALVGTRSNVLAAAVSALTPVLGHHAHLTVAAVVVGDRDHLHLLGPAGAPVFRGPEQAVRALTQARDHAAWRREAADLRCHVGRPALLGRTLPPLPA